MSPEYEAAVEVREAINDLREDLDEVVKRWTDPLTYLGDELRFIRKALERIAGSMESWTQEK